MARVPRARVVGQKRLMWPAVWSDHRQKTPRLSASIVDIGRESEGSGEAKLATTVVRGEKKVVGEVHRPLVKRQQVCLCCRAENLTCLSLGTRDMRRYPCVAGYTKATTRANTERPHRERRFGTRILFFMAKTKRG